MRNGLVKLGAGQYQTASGRFLVEFDVSYANECECIHCLDSRQHDCRSAVPGSRADKGWHVWDDAKGDYADGTGYQSFDRFKDAVAFAVAAEAEVGQ